MPDIRECLMLICLTRLIVFKQILLFKKPWVWQVQVYDQLYDAFAFQYLHDCVFSFYIHTGAHHFWEFCEVCFLIVLAWPGSLFASVFFQKFCLGPGICCILIGQLQPSGVVGFKKENCLLSYAHISGLYSWEWRRGLVVVSVTSLHPPASCNRGKKWKNKKQTNKQTKTKTKTKTKNKNKTKTKQKQKIVFNQISVNGISNITEIFHGWSSEDDFGCINSHSTISLEKWYTYQLYYKQLHDPRAGWVICLTCVVF